MMQDVKAQEFRIGIEEEYFVVEGEARNALRRMPPSFMKRAKAEIGENVSGELLQSQIEVMSRPHTAAAEVRKEVHGLRRTLNEVAGEFGMSFFASGTHPTARWQAGQRTPTKRYEGLMKELQMVGARNMLCGLHVHVELPDPDLRIDVMRRMLPFIPVFVALSTSSPFWESRRTGLMGYRLSAYDELPRTGLPELFENAQAYEEFIEALVATKAIKDSSYIWWIIRPSRTHPTLELRAPDSCTRVEDSTAIAALYRALARHLVLNPKVNASVDMVDRAIALENKWRAQRYGIHGSFVDRHLKAVVPVVKMAEDLIDMVSQDAWELGDATELAHLRTILEGGTSADIQISVYREAKERTGNRTEALRAVKTWLAHASVQ